MDEYKLFSIFYSDGSWGGCHDAYYIAKNKEEVIANSAMYQMLFDWHASCYDSFFSLHEVPIEHISIVDFARIENRNDFNFHLTFERKEIR